MILDKLFEQGIRLRADKMGDYKTTCPQCSRTRRNKSDPCLSVTIDGTGAVYNCHHCGWAGNVMDREFEYERFTPKPVVRPKPAQSNGQDDAMMAFFKMRSIDPHIVGQAGITCVNYRMNDTSIAYAFPFFKGGEVVNHKYRSPKKEFRQDKDALKVFFGMDKTEGFDQIYIVEGEMDALSLRQAGFMNVWSVPDGAINEIPKDPDQYKKKFSFIENCADEILAVKTFVLALDNDGNGQNMAQELARRLGPDKCFKITWPKGRKDANEVLVNDGVDRLIDCLETKSPWPIDGLYRAEDYTEQLLNLYRNGQGKGVSTGWDNLDKLLTIAEGQLTVLTGIPNSGKSEWLDALMVNLAEQQGWSFAVASLENPVPAHLSKLIEKRQRKPIWLDAWERMSEETMMEGLKWVNDHFFMVEVKSDKDVATLDWILQKFEAAVTRHNVKGVVIDPWNECEHQRPKDMTETEYIGQSLQKLKRFAALRGVHVFVVAHPAKMQAIVSDGKQAQRVPGLYDINGSANWANKADLGVVVHRPDQSSLVEIHVIKCRQKYIGQKGREVLNYDRVVGRYSI